MFKRLILKFFMMLIIVGGIGSYFAYMKGYSPLDLLAKFSSLKSAIPDMGKIENLDLLKTESDKAGNKVLKAGKTRVYKWQDEYGQWHYGQRAPTDADNVKSMVVDSNQNVIAGIKVPAKEDPEESKSSTKRNSKDKKSSKNEPDEGGSGYDPGASPSEVLDEQMDNPYNPDAIKKLFEDARGMQETLQKRFESTDQ